MMGTSDFARGLGSIETCAGMILKSWLEDPSGSPSRASRRVAVVLVAVALLVRGLVCFWDVQRYEVDPDAYRAIAETIAATGVFGLTSDKGEVIATAYRPPLYPWLLAGVLIAAGEWFVYGVAAFHTLLGSVTVLCTYRAARRLLGEVRFHRGSILAASLVLVDPILIHQSTLLMTETLAAALASLIVWWWVRHAEWASDMRSAAVLGILLALAYLCRPTFLVWALILCVCLAIAQPHLRVWRRQILARSAIALCIVAAAVGLWTVRNSRSVGDPVWATTHGGYTLLLANNPLFYDYLREGEGTWDADRFLLAYSHRYDGDPTSDAFWRQSWDQPGVITVKVTEREDDQLCYAAARATIGRQPGMFVWSCLVRAIRLWSPIPHRTEGRSIAATLPIALFYSLVWLAVIFGCWRLGRRFWTQVWWPIPTLIVTLTLVHAVYWSNIRMRAPAVPALAVMAGAAICRWEKSD